jgi:membrane-bound lytic murein transglycosylase A
MKISYKNIYILMLFLVVFLQGCYPSLDEEARRPDQALKPVKYFYPSFNDDIDLESLAKAINRNLEYLKRLDLDYVFSYGPDKFTCRQVIESQLTFLRLISSITDPKELNKAIKKNFRLYRATGRVGNRNVLFTGYFEPVYDARLAADEEFRYPLYGPPEDLVKINLSRFKKKYRGESIIARIEDDRIIPYYSRKEIENGKALDGRGLEIAWLRDPVDVAFLHIQGSGRLRLPDGKLISVGYATSNGRPYHSIGKYMLDMGYMSREEMSMQGIRDYLSKNPDVIDKVLNHNPSYIFFNILDSGPLGNIAVPITAGRSIALDSRIFPKGALTFIKSMKPVINSKGEIENWKEFSRFMMNQDTGGAINGAGRADIFWGSDKYAEIAAGYMQHEGDLYVLIKK